MTVLVGCAILIASNLPFLHPNFAPSRPYRLRAVSTSLETNLLPIKNVSFSGSNVHVKGHIRPNIMFHVFSQNLIIFDPFD